MSIYDKVTKRTREFHQHLKANNPFYKHVYAGSLTVDQLEMYLFNIKHSLKSTIPQCATGAKGSRKIGLEKLSKFFLHKIKEETGHDQWADEDLQKIASELTSHQESHKLLPEMQALIAFNNSLVKQDPRLYLIYMLFAEYFTVIAGPEFMEALEAKCHIPRSMISVVTKHAELDKDHVHEWEQTVRDCGVDLTIMEHQVDATLQTIMDKYFAFCATVGSLHVKRTAA